MTVVKQHLVELPDDDDDDDDILKPCRPQRNDEVTDPNQQGLNCAQIR